jgi:ComF family protein
MPEGSPTGVAALARVGRRALWAVTHGLHLHLDLLLPPHCLGCRTPMERPHDAIFLCGDCRRELAPLASSRCTKCGASLALSAADCPWCRRHQLQFDAVVPLGRYGGLLRAVVLRMKRPQHESLSWSMGRLMAQSRRESLVAWHADYVVPVPMHWSRRLVRAVNSPDVLASCVAGELGIPCRRVLRRARKTKLQWDLRVEERFRNLRGAFELRSGYDLGGARILLVDDILTTGATASAAATACRNAGAQGVAVVVLARAEGDGPG